MSSASTPTPPRTPPHKHESLPPYTEQAGVRSKMGPPIATETTGNGYHPAPSDRVTSKDQNGRSERLGATTVAVMEVKKLLAAERLEHSDHPEKPAKPITTDHHDRDAVTEARERKAAEQRETGSGILPPRTEEGPMPAANPDRLKHPLPANPDAPVVDDGTADKGALDHQADSQIAPKQAE